MKKIVLASLIALVASQAAGCIISSDDGDGDDFGTVSATWTLRSEATNSAASCPPGYDTAALINRPVTANGAQDGADIIDLFDCADGAGVSDPLPPRLYLTWLEITTATNSDTYAQSLSAFLDLTVEDKTFQTQILVDGGYFQFDWALRGASTNAALTCAQAGADGVESIGALVSNPNVSNSDIFDCDDGTGITAGYTAGTYTVSVHALDTSDAQLGDSVVLANQVIQQPNKVTDLGAITVPITGK